MTNNYPMLYTHFQTFILSKFKSREYSSLPVDISLIFVDLFLNTCFHNKIWFDPSLLRSSGTYFNNNIKFIYNEQDNISHICSINPFEMQLLIRSKSEPKSYKISGQNFFNCFTDQDHNPLNWDERFEYILYRNI